jgi:uncharacterized ubiquitin-like protein YukD
MILKHIGYKSKLFDGEIKNYKEHKKFIDNNPDFRQVQILNRMGKLIYVTYPMEATKAKNLTVYINDNFPEVFALMHLLIK